jgi:HK97 family phage portal protein
VSAIGEWIARRVAPKTSPQNVPSAAAMAWQEPARVGKSNVQLFRNWSEHSEWVRAAINVRKTQISSAEWDIVPYDKENKSFSPELATKIKTLFDTPNPRADSFRSFIEPIVEDVLVLDAGVVEKVRTLREAVAELWGVDGGKIKVSSLWDGDPNEARYWWYPDGQPRASFKNSDMLYIMANPSTYRAVGLSPLETLKATIDAELSGSNYNARQVQNAAPDGMLDLGEGARPEQVDQFKSYWQAEVAGKGAMAFIGGSKNAKFIPFRGTNRDMQFLEWQIYLVRKIAAVFGLSPQDLGVTFDINRATSEVQQEQTEDRGLRPLLALIQDYLTREIVWDAGFGGAENNLAFRFTRLNLKESLSRAQMYKLGLAGVSWMTVNEARIADGREPLQGDQYNELLVVTPTGAVSLDDVPTAREVMEKSKPTPADSAGEPKKPANAGSSSKGN